MKCCHDAGCHVAAFVAFNGIWLCESHAVPYARRALGRIAGPAPDPRVGATVDREPTPEPVDAGGTGPVKDAVAGILSSVDGLAPLDALYELAHRLVVSERRRAAVLAQIEEVGRRLSDGGRGLERLAAQRWNGKL